MGNRRNKINIPERNLEYRNELLDYLDCKNRTNKFIEGNMYILSQKIVDKLFTDKILYNILNKPNDFDYNWVRKRYNLQGDIDVVYNIFKQKKLKPRDHLSGDGYIEHAFTRIVLNMIDDNNCILFNENHIIYYITNFHHHNIDTLKEYDMSFYDFSNYFS